jgi:Right handed beta helix region/Protein of unknown function (DUF1565)
MTFLWGRMAALMLLASSLAAADFYVSPTGNDEGAGSKDAPWKTISHASASLKPGDTAHVLAGAYNEKVNVTSSGSADGGFVTLSAEGKVIVSGKGVEGENIFTIKDGSYVNISGFEIRDNLDVRDGSGIRVLGLCSKVELKNNIIHEIRGRDAMGITIYGTNPDKALTDIVIDGNEIYDCDAAQSEALTLNGNVSGFRITNNNVHDVNNIGICMIGGEHWVSKDRTKVTRNGICAGNKVARARSSYGDGYAAGIYVDGGSDIVIEDNEVTGSNLGIEIGAENQGTVTRGVIVRNNRIYFNEKAGLVFGGYDRKVGRVEGCTFENNFCYHNDTHHDKNGELWIQIASKNKITGNTFWSSSQGPVLQSDKMAEDNELDHNTYYSEAGRGDAFFNWREHEANGFEAYLRISKQDAHSKFERPKVAPPVSESRRH